MPTATVQKLLLSSAIAAGCIAGGASIWWAVDAHHEKLKIEHVKAKQERLEADNRLAHLSVEGAEIDQRVAHYRSLQKRGVVGEEKRLEWAESLQRLSVGSPEFGMRYSLSAQKPLDYRGIVPNDNAPLRMSQIKLEAQLLHEGEFFRLLSTVQKELPAHVSIRSCELSRKGSSETGSNLTANCLVDLVTMPATPPVGSKL